MAGERVVPPGGEERLDRGAFTGRPVLPSRQRELAEDDLRVRIGEGTGPGAVEQPGQEVAEVLLIAPGGERLGGVPPEVARRQGAQRPGQEGTVLLRRHAVRAAGHARRAAYAGEGGVDGVH